MEAGVDEKKALSEIYTFFFLHLHLHLNREGGWGTTDDFTTSFLYFCQFTTALLDSPNSRPAHSLILSFHLIFYLSCLLPPFTVPCKVVLARHDEWETCPYHLSLRLLTIVRRFDCLPEHGTDFLIGNMVFV